MDFHKVLEKRLLLADAEGTRRSLRLRQGADFSSNDYLGFAEDPALRERINLRDAPVGAAGSRLLRGHLELFEEVEQMLADFTGSQAALIFQSGYQANVGLLSALLRPGDTVFSDQNNHASIIDGIRLSGAEKEIYRHGDLEHLSELLKDSHQNSNHLKVIVTESLFGMDGDIAPLAELADLAEKSGALLIVDEAHATGLWGTFEAHRGAGLVQAMGLSKKVFATIHPAGKALGVGGAWVCGSSLLKDYLINFCRAFIFSTAPSPWLALLLKNSVEYWKQVGQERAIRVLARSADLSKKWGLDGGVKGPILPVILGSNERAIRVARNLQAKGLDVRAIRPPTVPQGTARLRVTLHWRNSDEEIKILTQAVLQELNI